MTTATATATAAQYAIVVNGASPAAPVPCNSAMVVAGPSADARELRELLYGWYAESERTGPPVACHLRQVAGPAEPLARTPDNAVIHESGGAYVAGWTSDAGYAAHPGALFAAQVPDGVEREVIAVLQRRPRRGYLRGAWVLEREGDGAELAVCRTRRRGLERLREAAAAHLAAPPA